MYIIDKTRNFSLKIEYHTGGEIFKRRLAHSCVILINQIKPLTYSESRVCSTTYKVGTTASIRIYECLMQNFHGIKFTAYHIILCCSRTVSYIINLGYFWV